MNPVNALDDKICEQLSAWMDGELPKDEAMFLERRLQHDEALQTLYSRMQIGSSYMKGHSARLMPSTLCANIKRALEEESSPRKSRKPLFAWAAAASLAFAAVVFIPGMMQNTQAPESTFASNSEPVLKPNSPATFASADLIANSPSAVNTSVLAGASTPTIQTKPAAKVSSVETVAGVESPENFPLNVSSENKAWPRSPVNANSDPALEAYLVRHNQMMAQDGMGGFVPYVDVVAQDVEQPGKNEVLKADESAGDVK